MHPQVIPYTHILFITERVLSQLNWLWGIVTKVSLKSLRNKYSS